MIIEKLMWVRHRDSKDYAQPINSVDVSSDGMRFATGGDDHKVIIWSIPNPKTMEKGASINRELTQPLSILTQHTLGVNCVRWSNHGRFLASASVDRHIFVWKLLPGKGGEFGIDPTPENWSCYLSLRGHNVDVVDCSWSPDDSLLASASLDNTIIVWKLTTGQGTTSTISGMNIAPFKILQGHEGFVKGIAFDPLGAYLTSSGDDHVVIVWRVGGDWGIVSKITEQYSAKNTTLFRRLSWSPDGSSLCTTNASAKTNDNVHTAAVIKREKWKDWLDLVGHDRPISTSKFSNSIYWKDSTNHCVLAMGSIDGVISVWKVGCPRPVAVFKNLWENKASVTDISWGGQNRILLVSAHDGSVVFIYFTENELGSSISNEEKEHILSKKYGGRVGMAVDSYTVPETPMQLEINQGMLRTEPLPISTVRYPNGDQFERPQPRVLGVKRKITPISISSQPAQQLARTEDTGLISQIQANSEPNRSQIFNNSGPFHPTVKIRPGSEIPFELLPSFLRPRDSNLIRQIKLYNGKLEHIECRALTVNVSNLTPSTYTEVSRGSESDGLIWSDFISGRVSSCCGNGTMTAIGCTDGSLYIYDYAGIRTGLPIVFEGEISHLECSGPCSSAEYENQQSQGNYLIVITSEGSVSSYDVSNMCRIVIGNLGTLARSMAPNLFRRKKKSKKEDSTGSKTACILPTIVSCGLSPEGFPIVLLECPGSVGGSYQAFMLHSRLQTWLRLADTRHIMSTFQSTLSTEKEFEFGGNFEEGIVRRLQNSVNSRSKLTFSAVHAGETILGGNLQHNLTRTHIEESINCALVLKSSNEIEPLLAMYARYLATSGRVDENRIRALCDRLLINSNTSGIDESMNLNFGLNFGSGDLILGKRRIDLLNRIVLPALSVNPNLQRIVQEYTQLESHQN